MTLFCSTGTRKKIAILLLHSLAYQIGYPSVAFALTSGPSQPEFSGFEPVGTKDMVNKFTGDFSYSIPVMEVPGPQGSSYPLNLAYHSGASVEDEASWVGYGWSLNPGAINRNARGIPDDFHDEAVTYWNKTPANYTLTAGASITTELFSGDLPMLGANASVNLAVRYNNYTGFGYNKGLGISLGKGIISLGFNESDGKKSYSAQVNPMAVLSYINSPDEPGLDKSKTRFDKSKGEFGAKKSLQQSAMIALKSMNSVSLLGGNHGTLDYNEGSRPTRVSGYNGEAFNITVGATVNPGPVPVGGTANLSGSYAVQSNLSTTMLKTYGYLYSAEATNRKRGNVNSRSKDILTDYYNEKDSPYNKRDVFLGIPFTSSDSYNVSSEGLGGSFQLHQPKAGEFGPNTQVSRTTISNIGADVSVGWTIGVGTKRSAGEQTLSESSWDEAKGLDLNTFSSVSDSDKPYFRFTNDLGGTVGTDLSNDNPVAARLAFQANAVRLDKNTLAATTAVQSRPNQGSHIGQHTIAEMADYKQRYCKRTDIEALRYAQASPKTIGEFNIVNESGRQYTYGLPVYSRNESNMQYGMQGLSANDIKENFLAYTNKDDIKIGEERPGAYATNYLLTEIVTSDYIDRNFNGPDEADFGSYTVFNYDKKHGNSTNDWYHWRFPYTGHLYEMNSLSDSGDDMGSISEGDKEIYYLQAVRTKTHTAIFKTSQRSDGFDALSGTEARVQEALNAAQQSSSNRRSLNKLDAIELYANSDVINIGTNGRTQWTQKIGAVPIKKIVFDYDYSLCQGTANSFFTSTRGKLTLKSVLLQYNSIATSKPYKFKYSYPSDFSVYPSVYGPAAASTSQRFNIGFEFSEAIQNPRYDNSKFSLDAWGNYQANGAERYRKLQTWLDQTIPDAASAAAFDPAAWQLKVITLPSGGEIHVQYEQDDYAYVQDKNVHALASLSEEINGVPTNSNPVDEFIVDLNSIGVNNRTDAEKCLYLVQDLYVNKKQKIFFKILYSLVERQIPQLTNCNTDYITGYVSVRNASVREAANGKWNLTLQVGKPTTLAGIITTSDYTLPRQVCWDFVQTQRLGKLRQGTNCNPAQVGINSAEPNKSNLLRQFAAWAKQVSFGNKTDLCAAINPSLSYFKIPMPTSKKGGGLRVKRLLTYDKGVDGVPVLYGSEYEYKAHDAKTDTWRSSGVATTEPNAMRVENALVEFIPRLHQGDFSKIISGPDRKQSEGPLGESILPAASVGYSRVTVKNIHSGKTNPGYSVTEYYTCKDAPMKEAKTTLQSVTEYRPMFTGFLNTLENNVWSAQGFAFILNSMHGQIRREATYAGPYSDINAQANSTLISEQLYTYFEPEKGDRLQLQSEPEGAYTQLPAREMPGKEVEITMAQRAVRDRSLDTSLEADIQFTPFFAYVQVWVTGRVSVSKFNSEFYSHTTSKVVRYPAIVKQVSSFHDGIRDTVENLAFDRYTGTPVAVRTSDGGRGAYLKQDVMASWVYPQLQGKALNEGKTLEGNNFAEVVTGSANQLYLKPRNLADCSLLATVRKGDVLALGTNTNVLYFAGAPDVASKRIQLYPYPAGSGAVGPVSKVTVVFSGNSNELKAQAGSTTYHGTLRKNVRFVSVNQFDADALATALQSAIRNISANNRTGDFTLSQTFTGVNVSGFSDRMPANCRAAATNATVRNLKFVTFRDPDQGTVKVQLMSFEVQCGGTSNVGFVEVK